MTLFDKILVGLAATVLACIIIGIPLFFFGAALVYSVSGADIRDHVHDFEDFAALLGGLWIFVTFLFGIFASAS